MRDSFNEINITPLTDIFLVLLIIMMVIAPLLDQQGLNLAVPEMVKQEDIKTRQRIKEYIANYTTLPELERVADHLVNVGYSVLNPTGSQSEAKKELEHEKA